MKKISKNSELVSVIIPTHSRLSLLKRAINSLLAQTYNNIEIIVVNDGSTDETKNWLETNQEVISIHQYPSKGACHARNLGIKKANGSLVTFLDDDDEFLPKRVQLLVENYYTSLSFICDKSIINYGYKTEESKFNKTPVTFKSELWQNTVGVNLLTEKTKLESIGGFDESFVASQDYDLSVTLLKVYGDAKRLPVPLRIVHFNHDMGRISTSNNRWLGFLSFYNKFSKDMTTQQRLTHIFKLKGLQKKHIPAKFIFFKSPLDLFLRRLKHYILQTLKFR